MNKISSLRSKPFSTCTIDEKLHIKQLGRPLPDLVIVKTFAPPDSGTGAKNPKVRTRKFNRDIYSKNNWLCGCKEKNAFFCFPCVLFGGDSQWTKKGITDLVHIWDKLKKHDKSKTHINNVFSLSILGKTSILTQLNSAYRQTITAHNEQVDKNRYLLNIIINCIRFSGALELALRGHDETDESYHKGVFKELINFSAVLDKDLEQHFSKSTVFDGSSKTIRNELLECMLDVYYEEVAKEIKHTEYVAVIADETTDVAGKFQLVVILRYIVGSKPVERFWNFLHPTGHDAASISDCILTEIAPLISETPEKLISQSYDGPSIMNGGLNGVQMIIKENYPLAYYVHCYAHQFNLITRSAASVNRSAEIFFAHLSGICSFFSTSVLDEIVQRSSETKWNFHSRGINTVFDFRKQLINVMESLENDENIKLASTIEQAGAYKLRLKDETFVFWLTIFHKITPHVEVIFNQLQEKNIDASMVKLDLKMFENAIQEIRDELDLIITEFELEFSEDGPPPQKRQCTLAAENTKREALEVCDSIVEQIKTRFSFTGHLVAAKLFMVENFTKYRKIFPDYFLCEVVEFYPFLEKHRLKTELQVLYEREESRDISGAVSFLSLISQKEMRGTFLETLKLLKVLVTIPMSTSEGERCFSVLKSIKTFLRNTMKEERLSPLGMLSAEKAFLNNIEDFNMRVIELFANKKGRVDFMYRAF